MGLEVMKDNNCLVAYKIKLAREYMLKNQKPLNKPKNKHWWFSTSKGSLLKIIST